MKTLFKLTRDDRTWLAKWTLYPLLAYYASFVFLYLMPLVFILLLTLVQWNRLKRLTNHPHAGYWGFILLIYPIFVWLASYWPLADHSLLSPTIIACVALIYYGTQAFGGFFIKPLTDHWHWKWYLAGHAIAVLLWVVGISLMNGLVSWLVIRYTIPIDVELIRLFVTIPVLGMLANLTVGLGLLTAVASPRRNEVATFPC